MIMGLLHGIGLLATFALAAMESGRPLGLPQADGWRSAVESPDLAISADGRFVAFASQAALLPADTNRAADVYVFDTRTGQLTMESIGIEGNAADGASANPALSADGRMLAFDSIATNLVDAPTGVGRWNVYVRDRARGETRRVSTGAGGGPANGESLLPSISADGRLVVFESSATNLVDARDANGMGADVYLVDLDAGTTERASVNSAGEQAAAGTSFTPRLSADGRLVAFTSTADLECAGPVETCPPWRQDTNGVADVYVRDLRSGVTRRVSRGAGGAETLATSHHPAPSADGRFIAFVSSADNLVEGDRNQAEDVFLCEVETGAITLVSRQAGSNRSASGRSLSPDISADGRFVGFQSNASDLVCARHCASADVDRNGTWDVFLFDVRTERAVRVSADPSGLPWAHPSTGIRVDGRAELVAFQSTRPLSSTDTATDYDLFLRWMRGLGSHGP